MLPEVPGAQYTPKWLVWYGPIDLAHNSCFKTSLKKVNPTPGTDFSLKSLTDIIDAPWICKPIYEYLYFIPVL